jgi:hypothetical protein
MLNLPVNQLDESGDPPAQRARFAPPPADPHPTPLPNANRRPAMRLLDGSAPVAPPSGPPVWEGQWNINLNPQQGSSVFGPRPPVQQVVPAEPAPPVWRAETVAVPPPDAAPVPQPPMPVPPVAHHEPSPTPMVPAPHFPAPEPAPVALLPFVAVNRMFDAAVVGLGPLGEWLCTSAGRAMVGYTGLALLAGSVAWGAAELLGWPG